MDVELAKYDDPIRVYDSDSPRLVASESRIALSGLSFQTLSVAELGPVSILMAQAERYKRRTARAKAMANNV
jgi:hypothetical protein